MDTILAAIRWGCNETVELQATLSDNVFRYEECGLQKCVSSAVSHNFIFTIDYYYGVVFVISYL